jgi:hypothetical protein
MRLIGKFIVITGSSTAANNGVFPITWMSAHTFTYTISGAPTSPATGVVLAWAASDLVRSGSTATMTLPNHGFLEGQTIIVSGAWQAEYNGSFVIFNVTQNTQDKRRPRRPVSA